MNDEFYIGWLPKAPAKHTKYIRIIISVIAVFVITAASLLATRQRTFSTATFEYGRLTEMKGVYRASPFPSLKVNSGTGLSEQGDFITMPLVGYGKSGAEGVISALEKEVNGSLNNKEITLKGTLLYGDGKALFQIDRFDKPLLSVNAAAPGRPAVIKELGKLSLTGEIVDPKCYFGVMKPGEGKPHRDCAARCIAGGINPVLRTTSATGETSYCLLLDETGKQLNGAVKDHVGEPVSLMARAVRYDDWIILYVDQSSIKRTVTFSWSKYRSTPISCGP